MHSSRNKRPRRKWYQFSLRLMLLFVLVAAIPLAWYGKERRWVERRMQAIETLREAGAVVRSKSEVNNSEEMDQILQSSGLISMFGPEYYFDEHTVDFNVEYPLLRSSRIRIRTDEIAALRALPGLQMLDLTFTDFNDAGMASLPEMPNLEELTLYDTNVGDDGLDHLRKFPALRRLSLTGTDVTGEGLKHLRHVPRLQRLALAGVDISDGLKHLRHCPDLRRISVSAAAIDSWSVVPDMPSLEEVYVFSSGHGEQHALPRSFFQALSRMPHLNRLIVEEKLASPNEHWRELPELGDLRELDYRIMRTRTDRKNAHGEPDTNGEAMTSAFISSLHRVPGLQRLRIEGAMLNDKLLSEIAELKELDELSLIGCRFIDDSLTELLQIAQIHILEISGPQADLSLPVFAEIRRRNPRFHVYKPDHHHD